AVRAAGSVSAALPSSTVSSRRFCAWMSASSSVRFCQICTAQNVATTVRKLTCSAPKNIRVSLERSVMPSPHPVGHGGGGRCEAKEGDALEQRQQEQRSDQERGGDRTLQERIGDQDRDREAAGAEHRGEREDDRLAGPHAIDQPEHQAPDVEKGGVRREEIDGVEEGKKERGIGHGREEPDT